MKHHVLFVDFVQPCHLEILNKSSTQINKIYTHVRQKTQKQSRYKECANDRPQKILTRQFARKANVLVDIHLIENIFHFKVWGEINLVV